MSTLCHHGVLGMKWDPRKRKRKWDIQGMIDRKRQTLMDKSYHGHRHHEVSIEAHKAKERLYYVNRRHIDNRIAMYGSQFASSLKSDDVESGKKKVDSILDKIRASSFANSQSTDSSRKGRRRLNRDASRRWQIQNGNPRHV